MELQDKLYKEIAKKSDLDIMFIIENPSKHEREIYYAAVEIALQRGIISKSELNEEFNNDFKRNVNDIIAIERAKQKKPLNFLVIGLILLGFNVIMLLLQYNIQGNFSDTLNETSLAEYLLFLAGLVCIIAGIVQQLKKIFFRNKFKKP